MQEKPEKQPTPEKQLQMLLENEDAELARVYEEQSLEFSLIPNNLNFMNCAPSKALTISTDLRDALLEPEYKPQNGLKRSSDWLT